MRNELEFTDSSMDRLVVECHDAVPDNLMDRRRSWKPAVLFCAEGDSEERRVVVVLRYDDVERLAGLLAGWLRKHGGER